MWNAETAQHLRDWYATREGSFALAQENLLFQRLVSQWPRRGHTLLDVGCGTGLFLEMLWQQGFDVTGFDTNTTVLDMARKRLGNRADFQLGQPDHLPFDDKTFDYAALLSILEYVEKPEDVLAEALRVSRRGVIVGFMNSLSVCRIQKHFRKTTCPGQHPHNMNIWFLTGMARKLCPNCRLVCRSVLLGPPSTWNKPGLWHKLNTLQLPFPLGGYVGVCIETGPRVSMTPLLLKAREKAFRVCGTLQPETNREAPSEHPLRQTDSDHEAT